MRWRKLGIGLFIVGAFLIATGLVQNATAWLTPTPAPRHLALSAGVRDCAAKFDGLTGSGLTRTGAQALTLACDTAIVTAPRNCSAFLAAAGRAGFTAEQGLAAGGPSDLEPYLASRRDALANREQCYA